MTKIRCLKSLGISSAGKRLRCQRVLKNGRCGTHGQRYQVGASC